MRALKSGNNIVDDSNPTDYPDAKIKDNTGSGDGTGVNEAVYGDIHQTIAKAMRLYGITPNGLPENENPSNGFQIIEALRALASKNDFILPITTSSGVLGVPIKLSYMLDNEQVVCKASVAITTETQIKGTLDNVTYTITKLGDFKVGEYVRLVKTASTVVLIRLADATNLDLMVGDFSYLKKASQAEENAGAIDTKATTPLSNLTAFVKRVIGLDSPNYLATAIRNGLYPKEHFAIVASLDRLKAVGGFSNLDVGGTGVGTTLPPFGDILTATATNVGYGFSSVRVVLKPGKYMNNTNYKVQIDLQMSGGYDGPEASILTPTFKVFDNTQFDLVFRELATGGLDIQNLIVHLDLIQL